MAGPGPKYKLPSLTGFTGHDLTKRRLPAYSVAFRQRDLGVSIGIPGPKFDPGRFVRTGRFSSPNAVVLPRREALKSKDIAPSPLKYFPGPDPSFAKSPSAVILNRTEAKGLTKSVTPGPKYLVKGVVGRKVEDLPSAPSWSMIGRNFGVSATPHTPGPRYGAVDMKLTMVQYPRAMVTPRREQPKGTGVIPGPKYDNQYRIFKYREPSWSFGVKHTDKEAMVLMNADRQPFYGF